MNSGDNRIQIAIKLRRAKSTLHEINHHIQFKYYNTALSRLYYSCFYAVQALLLSIDISPKSHKGVRTNFSRYFIKENIFPKEFDSFFNRMFDERQFADYMDIDEIDEETIHILLEKAHYFIQHIEKLLEQK